MSWIFGRLTHVPGPTFPASCPGWLGKLAQLGGPAARTESSGRLALPPGKSCRFGWHNRLPLVAGPTCNHCCAAYRPCWPGWLALLVLPVGTDGQPRWPDLLARLVETASPSRPARLARLTAPAGQFCCPASSADWAGCIVWPARLDRLARPAVTTVWSCTQQLPNMPADTSDPDWRPSFVCQLTGVLAPLPLLDRLAGHFG